MANDIERKLTINGVEHKLDISRHGDGPPADNTPGKPGVLYVDTSASPEKLYVCTAANSDSNEYTWKPVESLLTGMSAGSVAKPVFFVSTMSADGTHACIAYYDNRAKAATIEEVVDAYMAGTAFFVVNSPNVIERIHGFTVSRNGTGGHVTPIIHREPIYAFVTGSTDASLAAAMAKYLP